MPAHASTRKSCGLMTRKLSVIKSRNSDQFCGTFSRKKVSASRRTPVMWRSTCCGSHACASRPIIARSGSDAAISWDEMQPDPAAWLGEPILHKLGMMVARVVQINMDHRQQRIQRFERFQKPDRRGGVDGFSLDHAGMPGIQVNSAVNVDALPSAGLFNRQSVFFGVQRPTGRAAWVGCTASRNSTASSGPSAFSSFS